MNKNLIINDTLERIPGCVYWKDVNGVFLGCNQIEAETFGLRSPEDLIGKTDY